MPRPTKGRALGGLFTPTSVIEWRSVYATIRIPRYCTWHEDVMRNVYLIDRVHFPLAKFALNLDPVDPIAKPLLVTMLLEAVVPGCVLQSNY